MLGAAFSGCAETRGAPAESETLRDSAEHARLELETTFPVALGYVSHVRERTDGSVLAADPLAPALLRLDFGAGTLDTLGRVGDGPEEYRQPDRVLPLPADSTLMVDLGRLRFVVVAPEGGLVDGFPMTSGSQDELLQIMEPTRFTDGRGRLYYAGHRSGRNALPDSIAVVRFDRVSEQHDTVAFAWIPPIARDATGRVKETLLTAADDWAVAEDGAVAVIRADPYRVEWLLPDGERVVGPEYRTQSHPVTDADKTAAIDEMAVTGSQSFVLSSGGGMRMRMSRGIPREGLSVDRYEWSTELPAFTNRSTHVSPRNELWVERMRPVGEATVADVFDRSGRRRGQVDLPLGRRLAGFGRGGTSAFLVRTDAYGLHWLERYDVRYRRDAP